MFVEFDVESSGVDTRRDRIVQWTVVTSHPRAEPSILAEVVDPGVPIPAAATEVHGYTQERLAEIGADPAESLDRMLASLADAVQAKIPIVGMNLAYDFGIAHWEAVRHGIPTLLERTGGIIMPVLDLLVLDKMAEPRRRGSRKLADTPEKGPGLASHYGIELRTEDAHDAVADAMATGATLRALARRHVDSVGSKGLMYLYTAQVQWRADQAASLQRWLRREKDPEAYCDPCWPLCLDLTHPTG
jgi:DNA polymerase-3 subunit epsilon